MPSDMGSNAPRPRLCHLVKWSDFDGYGFNLHAEKSQRGQFIGKVDENSPAESAGMKEGDRIIEVNGVNVSNENHKQVVERIKAIPNETKLLVVDLETDKYYKSKKMVVKGGMSNVSYQKTASTRPNANNAAAEHDDNKHSPITNGGANNGNGTTTLADAEADERRSHASSVTSDGESLNQDGDKISTHGSNLSTPPIGRNEDETRSSSSASPDVGSTPPLTPTGGPALILQRSVSSEGVVVGGEGKGLNLNMTASEMRALLASRKKYDPKKENLDLRKKHAIIQDM